MKKYLRHKIANIVVVDEICALEHRNYSGAYSKETDNHDFWEICFIESGTVPCVINGKELVLKEHEMIFIPPNTPHKYNQSDKAKIFCICFECISPYLKPLGLRVFKPTYEQLNTIFKLEREGSNSFTNNQDEQLVRLPQQKLGCMQMLIILLEYLILLTLRQLVDDTNSPLVILQGDDFYESLIEKIKQYCHEHIKKRLSLDEICSNIGYSRSFTCKLFKTQTGESIFTYFNRLKIEEAKKLLKHTNYNASQISEILEFTDAKYFNTSFKKLVGVSPIQYKRELQKELKSKTINLPL